MAPDGEVLSKALVKFVTLEIFVLAVLKVFGVVIMFALLVAVSLSVFRASLGCTSTGVSDGGSVGTMVLRESIIDS